jgi:hypothetical protein
MRFGEEFLPQMKRMNTDKKEISSVPSVGVVVHI